MKIAVRCHGCGVSLDAEIHETSMFDAVVVVKPCEFCSGASNNEAYNRGAATGYETGLKDAESTDQRALEEAVRGALEEGRAEGYSGGLAEGRRLGREEAGKAPPEETPPQAVEPYVAPSPTGLYIVRHYDGFDHDWMDVSEPVSEEKAREIWAKKTKGGTRNTNYRDIDYYAVFASDTRMVFSEGRAKAVEE